ncbi:hypothetical protein HQ590_12825, partial [bacterium]|nr:hypothetical protein [bacterium]
MLNPESAEPRTETVDLKEYISVLLKRKWLILVCFLLSMAGTTAFLFTRQPIYRAMAKLLVRTMGSALPSSNVIVEQNFFSTMVGIMRSRTMLQRVQQRMKKTPMEISELLKDYNIRGGGGDIMIIMVDSPSRDFAREFANTLAEEYLRLRDEQKAQTSESALLMLTREINRLSQELRAADERIMNYATENNFPILESQREVVRWQFQTVIRQMG